MLVRYDAKIIPLWGLLIVALGHVPADDGVPPHI